MTTIVDNVAVRATVFSTLTTCLTCHIVSAFTLEDAPLGASWRCSHCGRLFARCYWRIRPENAKERRARLALSEPKGSEDTHDDESPIEAESLDNEAEGYFDERPVQGIEDAIKEKYE